MSTQTFSRSYLQGVPALRKQQYVESLFAQGRYSNILTSAEAGRTSYSFEVENKRDQYLRVQPCDLTEEEWMCAIQKLFPECTIHYEEVVEGDMPGGKILKWKFTIDWS